MGEGATPRTSASLHHLRARAWEEAASRWLVPLMLWAVTLAAWPWGEAPFSRAKTAVLLVCAGALLLRALLTAPEASAPLPFRVLAGLWPATLALSALLGPAASPGGMWLELGAGLVLLALVQAPPEPEPALRAIAGAGTVLAGVALLQALGLDPFSWGGWHNTHPGERMRVYGTLGNPDFVAAFLGASLCVTVGEAASALHRPHRVAWAAATLLQLGALASTRSWASLLALGAAALTVGLGRINPHPSPLPEGEGTSTGSTHLTPAVASVPRPSAGPRNWRPVARLALGAVVLLVLVPWGRSPGSALEGRRYLLNVAAPHAVDSPVLGHGPDSFEVLWPAWEAAYWAAGAPEAERRFAAPQNHAHNDYLEWWLELGLVGSAPRVLLLLAALHAGRRAVDARGVALTAALAALAARALVDFPLSRPAELCLLTVLLALSFRLRSQS